MRFGVLGTLEIRRGDGESLEVRGAKERLLLSVLVAAYPDAVSVDRLIDQLWNGDAPRTARKSLQAHVVRLRTALEPDRPPGSSGRYVVRRREGYALAAERDQLDATDFADRVASGRALLAAGDSASARELLAGALALWRGTPFLEWPDSPELDQERQRLQGIRDLATEAFWEAELALGRHAEAVPELERLVAEQPLHENRWALLALAQYRCGRQGHALEVLRRARAALAEELGIDPGPRLRGLEAAVLAQDPSLDLDASPSPIPAPATGPEPAADTCPYQGLARYEIEDADRFRGRDHLVRTLVTTLVDHRLVVVSGSSGAGKSSVVRAGLLPALGAAAIPGSDGWRGIVATPGARAVDSLAAVTGADDTGPVVLVCDQLEQLWSPETSSGERVAFLDTVLGLLQDDVAARVLLVVRGDHLGRLAEHADLAERMLGALVMVPPMTEVELRQVVVEPAEAAGLTVEPDLTDVAVRDVLGRSGALPLLSTALAQTWLHRRDGVLTLAGYLASGGVTGAVGRSAELVFDTLTEDERERARRVLVRLAEQDEEGTVRARRLPVAELATDGDRAVTERVVERFVSSRLLSRDGAHVEVAHEALLTAWPRLAAWLDEDAAGRAVRRHLAPAALEWDAHGRPADELYRGARLEAAAQWVDSAESGATELEREYVAAGLAQAEAELTAARERAEAEAASRRRTRRFATMLAAALILALLATGIAVFFQDRADDRAAAARAAGVIADANRLAALSGTARSLDVSLLLAAAAVQTADTPATRDGLLDTLVEHRRADRVHQLTEESVEETALSANGRTLVASIGGGSPRVVAWRPGSGEPPQAVLEGDDSLLPEHLAVSPDGRRIVATVGAPEFDFAFFDGWTTNGQALPTPPAQALGFPGDLVFTSNRQLLVFSYRWAGARVGYQGTVQRVDLGTQKATQVAVVGRTGGEGRDVTFKSAFADDGSAVVSWTTDGKRAFWSDVAGGRTTRLRLAPRAAVSVEFVATPVGALQLWSDGAMTRYDARGRAVQVLDAHDALVRDAVLLPDGRRAVTVGDGGQAELWSVDPNTGDWALTESLVGHVGAVQQVEVSSDGEALLTAARDGQVITWDLALGGGFGTAYPAVADRWVSNDVQVVEPGRLVVAAARSRPSRGGRAELVPGVALDHGPGTASVAALFWDPRNGRLVDEVVVGDTATSYLFGSSASVSPDGRVVAVTSGFATTVLDARTRERVARIPMPQADGALQAVWSAAWTPDGSRLLLGAEGITSERAGMMAVDTESWRVTDAFLSKASVQVMAWSPDGSVLAAGINYRARIDLYDPDLRKVGSVELGEGGDAFDLAFSPDGSMLAAARSGGGVTVLDTRTWRPVHETATMHADHTLDVEWLPDGSTVVSTGADEVVSLYDVERDLVRSRPLPASDTRGRGVSYLLPPSADEIVVLNQDGPGHRYPLDPARWLARACDVAGRDLTRAEWARYVPDRPYEPVCDLGGS